MFFKQNEKTQSGVDFSLSFFIFDLWKVKGEILNPVSDRLLETGTPACRK